MQRVQALHASFEFRGNTGFDELALDGVLHLFQEALVDRRLIGDLFLQGQG